MDGEPLCARCARHAETCCQNSDIYVTRGDVLRIKQYTGEQDFVEWRGASHPVYLEQDDDPTWRDHVWQSDGTRRVLKQKPSGDCLFLDANGCRLPLDVRPLICRLYPYSYTEQGLEEKLARGCPLELLRPGENLIDSLQMNLESAERWHRQLYEEIHAERLQNARRDAYDPCPEMLTSAPVSSRNDETHFDLQPNHKQRDRDCHPSKRKAMHLGITFDLRSEYLAAGFSELETAEFDSAETIDALEWALTTLGHQVDRIGHARQLVSRLAAGDRWDGVFNISEGLYGLGREAQVPAVLDAFQIPYTFSDPLVMSLSLHKGHTKTILQQAGITTPAYFVAESMDDLKNCRLRYPAFVKPVAEGTGKGVSTRSQVDHFDALVSVADILLKEHRQPVLIEEYLSGREFTVGILGTAERARVLGTLEIILKSQADPGVYSYRNKEQCETLVEYRLVRPEHDPEVQEAEQIALRAWNELGCRDGGRIDLRSNSKARPQFLEVNPLAGLHPTHSDLPMLATAVGMDYVTLIGHILESACTRWMTHENSRPAQSSV